jgi:TusE/DsrC/DsvC family sulfur relay protein
MKTREIEQRTVHFDDDGFMTDPNEWSKEIAQALAAEIGLPPLNERHWRVIEFCRADYGERGESPTLRRITQAAGVPTKELYQLFPKGPAKKVAYVAGLSKPSGCI